jgi:hypothetical protein
MGNDHSCWVCAHQQIGGDSFLGLCRWFETKGQPKKPIPPDVVDAGCKLHELAPARYWATHSLSQMEDAHGH